VSEADSSSEATGVLRWMRNSLRFAPIAAALFVILWLALEIAHPTFEMRLEPNAIGHYDANRYETPVVLRKFYRVFSIPSDGPSNMFNADIEVYEDGLPLGPPHSMHDDIASKGGGRFSYWTKLLIFSSSDNSPPNSNGRVYTIKTPLEPHIFMRMAGALCVLFLAIVGTNALHRRAGSIESVTAGAPTHALRSASLSILGLSSLLIAGWIALEVSAPAFKAKLDPAAVQQGGGSRYSVDLRPYVKQGLYKLPSDTGAYPMRSPVLLYENDRRLGPRHAAHQDIQNGGKGAYSHWYDTLTFSASDNSDPRANGRTYTAEGRYEPAGFVRLAGWLGLLGLAIGCIGMSARNTSGPELARKGLAILFDGSASFSQKGWLVAGLAVLFAAIPILAYLGMLANAHSSGLVLGAYFPISDASGYWGCANEYLEYGETDVWCHRRPLYSMMLATVTMLSGRSLEAGLILQAALMGLCAFVFAREVARWLGALPALIASFIILQFAWPNALGVTMTEVGGLCVGLIAAAVLLRAAEQKSLRLAVLGAFMFGLGENIRPGALFALPFLVVWVATLKGFDIRRMAMGAVAAGAAIAVSFGIHSIYVSITGGDPANSFSNTAMTIYGFAHGGNWTLLVNDHPELLSETKAATQEIYRLAIEQMKAHPDIAFHGMVDNVYLNIQQQWTNLAFPDLPAVPLYFLGGLTALAASLRSQRARLVLVVMAGEAMSAAFIERDGGVRLWAASGGLGHVMPTMLMLSLAGRWLLGLLLKFKAASAAPLEKPVLTALPVRAAAIACLFIAAPVAHAVLLRPVKAIDATACGNGLVPYVIDLDEMAVMTVSDVYREPMLFPHRISTDDLLKSLGDVGWYRDSVARLHDVRVLRGVVDAPRYVGSPGFYISAATPAPQRGRILACVDQTQQIEVAQAPFWNVVSAKPL